MSDNKNGTDQIRETLSDRGLLPLSSEEDLKIATIKTTVRIKKENEWVAVVLGWLAGSIVLISYLAIVASPESSYIEWSTFFCGVTVSLAVIRFYYGLTSEFLVLVPLLAWHSFWALVHASRGNLCASCLAFISGSLILIAVVHFCFKLFGLRSEK